MFAKRRPEMFTELINGCHFLEKHWNVLRQCLGISAKHRHNSTLSPQTLCTAGADETERMYGARPHCDEEVEAKHYRSR